MKDQLLETLFAPEYRMLWLWIGGALLWVIAFGIAAIRSINRAIPDPSEPYEG